MKARLQQQRQIGASMILVPEKQCLDEGLIGVVAEVLLTIGHDGHVDHVDEHAEHERHGVGLPLHLRQEEAEECQREQKDGTENEQTAAAPGVLEVLQLLLLLQVGLEGFLGGAIVLDAGQGGVVPVVGAYVPDAALKRLQVDAFYV